jgi:RHS repeat-associated protein
VKILLRILPLFLATAAVAQPTSPSGTYAYDGAGNITAIGSNIYSYDAVGRLTKAVVVSGGVTHIQEFTYDAYGNMTSAKTDGILKSIGIDADRNRLTDVVADAYDESGNLRIDGSFQYTYDSLGQMSEKVAPSVHEYYVYDASDERVAVRAAADNWQITFRDLEGEPLRSFRGSELNSWSQQWTWVQDWVWRDGQLLGSERAPTDGGRQHYHLDHLGTPRLATTTNSVAVARHDYYPYGVEITPLRQETAAGFSQEQAMKFTGHERDFTGGTAQENTNYLDYMHARTYSAEWGRFLSPDRHVGVVGGPQTWNRYNYAYNNPLTLLDPDGNEPKDSKIIHVHASVVYSNADRTSPPLMMRSLRQRTEAGIVQARQHYAKMGIALSVTRYEGYVADNRRSPTGFNGYVTTSKGQIDALDFIKSNAGRGLTVFATADVHVSGGSSTTGIMPNGLPVFTVLGATAGQKDLEHELAHSFGNSMPSLTNPFVREWVGNTTTDFTWFAERTQHDLFPDSLGFSFWFEEELRQGAAVLEVPSEKPK